MPDRPKLPPIPDRGHPRRGDSRPSPATTGLVIGLAIGGGLTLLAVVVAVVAFATWPESSPPGDITAGQPAQTEARTEAPPVKPRPSPRAVAGRDGVRLGEVEVFVTKVVRGHPVYLFQGARDTIPTGCLTAHVRLRNVAWEGAVAYRGWSPKDRFGKTEPGPHPARLTAGGRPLEAVSTILGEDDRDGPYLLEGSLRVPAVIRAGKEANDVLLFAAPKAGAGPLRLTLPGAAVGARGEAVFDVPAEMIEKPERKKDD